MGYFLYLLDRTYKVVSRGIESRLINATLEVPQGSNLGCVSDFR